MTAVLGCDLAGGLGGASALRLLRLTDQRDLRTEVCVPSNCYRAPRGVVVHRRRLVFPSERREHRLIPVTSPALTIVDNALRLGNEGVEAAINEASQRDLATPEAIRRTAERYRRVSGSRLVRAVLDRDLFELTDTELERLFRRLLRRFGLPQPETQRWLHGFRVDFHWPELGLVVECDSLRYHRTAAKQRRDAERDQVLLVAGLTPMRFTHWQVRYAPEVVAGRLEPVIARLAASGWRAGPVGGGAHPGCDS